MEVTALCIRLLVNVLLLFTAQELNRHSVHTADAAFLRINPNRLQFFEYDHISLRCAGFHGATGWRVMRNVPSNATWETSAGSLDIKPAFQSHSGGYWCENGDGERSNTLNITVTAGDVILDSPVLPVMETQDVTLHCRKRATSRDYPADFFKDGLFSRTGYTGVMTIHNVSKSDEGLYKCVISGAQSPEGWLAVREYITPIPGDTTAQDTPETTTETSPHPRSSPGSDQLSIQLSVVFTILCVAVLLLAVGVLQYRKHRAACAPPEIPPRGSGSVFEHVSVADIDKGLYANVPRRKKKRGRQEENLPAPKQTYSAVKKKKRAACAPPEMQTRGSGSAFEHASAADPNIGVYANVQKKKKKRGRQEENLPAPKQTYSAVKKKKRAACASPEMQTRGSGSAFEHASAADPSIGVYANVQKKKKKRGRQEENLPAPKQTYSAVKNKKRVSGVANVSNTNGED